MDKSFAQLYHDLDGGFTPLVSLVIRGDPIHRFADRGLCPRAELCLPELAFALLPSP